MDKKIPKIKKIGEPLDDNSLSIPTEVAIKKAIDEITSDLLIDTNVIKQIISSLVAGKHILLTGPVGTGKTHLANILPKLVWKDNKYNGYHCKVVTANSEWTTQDVIGGILPKVDKENDKVTYQIQDGCVIETIKNNYDETDRYTWTDEDGIQYRGDWLVIDEFNRANIDRAFGPLFTAIQGFSKNVLYPTTDPDKTSEEIKIPDDYRIIGTLNTADKHFLNQLSFALKRRFDIISIEPPTSKERKEELRIVEKRGKEELLEIFTKEEFGKIDYNEHLDTLFEIFSFIRKFKQLGTAFPISMFKFMVTNYSLTTDWAQSIDLAFTRQIFPQIEELSIGELEIIREFCLGTIAQFYVDFDRTARDNEIPQFSKILQRILEFRKESGKLPKGGSKRFGPNPIEVIVSDPNLWIEQFSKGDKFPKRDTSSVERQNILDQLNTDINPLKDSNVRLVNFAKAIKKLIDEKSYADESFVR